MILSRITTALKEQNWVAVTIEFVIVILGVVIGFQVTAWNAGRSERAREAAYLERLHAEIDSLKTTRDWLVSRREANFERMVEFADILNGLRTEEPSQEHCNAIGRSFVVSQPTDSLAVLDELISVGGLETIRSVPVRAAVTNYLLVTRRSQDANALSQQITVVLHSQFPHLVSAVSRVTEEGRLGMQFECDFEGMRADAAFLSVQATNGFSLNTHVQQNRLVDGALAALHRAVDDALGLSADDHGSPQETPQ